MSKHGNTFFFIGALLVASLLGSTASQAADSPGKTLYLKMECDRCHGIKAEGVKSRAADDEQEDGQTPIDLSGVGSKRTGDWLTKYLNKQEAVDGKKHPKNWTGSAADLKTMSDYLGSLKK